MWSFWNNYSKLKHQVHLCREFRMSGGKKRSGFQITSVTSDFKQTPNDQSAPSTALTAQGSAYSLQGSSSQPTTPSLKRRYASHDASAQEAGCSRFRVVRLAVSGPGGGSGRGKPYHRGRWTCTEFMEREEVLGIRRVLDTMRHAHSLESLEMIGRDADRGGVHSQGATHLLCQPVKNKDSSGAVIHSGPPSPTHKGPVNVRLLDCKEPGGAEQLDSSPSSPPAHPRVLPPPLQLEAGRHGQHILRLSHSQPSSPPAGSNHLAPVRTPATFSLDQTFFSLTQDASSANNLIAIDNKIEQAMDLVKSHLMLAVREEVELLKEQIRELQDKNQHLEKENLLLRTLTHDVPNTQNT
ncbi:TSC22 domain family protein 4 isoform X2 [Takifugu rubripes]|uniref:TSC22 domain family protein 4 isoform X2 n=1 Tax=Takifugu rubripes TaxID=31033 RepID=UPI0011454CBA|nr:TSC22 domain family protein 4 isoform X2 [Takifugu rubripes]